MPVRRAVLVLVAATSMTLVTGGPAWAAGAATAGRSAPVTVRTAAAAGLVNYQISGAERAVGCLTAVRCVAVGSGIRDGRPGGQVVEVVGGKQRRVSAVRYSLGLYAVSCPSRAGCWAMGMRKRSPTQLMVQIGPAGTVTRVIPVKLPAGVPLNFISCSKMTSCEVWGAIPNYANNAFYFGRWTGKKLRLHGGLGGGDSAGTGGLSCWQATCTAAGGWCDDDCYNSGDFVIITERGRLVKVIPIPTSIGMVNLSCVSSATCYLDGGTTVTTLDDGVPGTTQVMPVYPPDGGPADVPDIACAGATCWTTGPAPDHPGGPEAESVFVKVTDGVPASSVVVDTAMLWPSITRRGNGFAAVGEAVGARHQVTEFVTG